MVTGRAPRVWAREQVKAVVGAVMEIRKIVVAMAGETFFFIFFVVQSRNPHFRLKSRYRTNELHLLWWMLLDVPIAGFALRSVRYPLSRLRITEQLLIIRLASDVDSVFGPVRKMRFD